MQVAISRSPARKILQRLGWTQLMLACLGTLLWACGAKPVLVNIRGYEQAVPVDTILDTAAGRTIAFEDLIDQLARVQVVYVGERHTLPAHHTFQRRVIEALVQRGTLKQVGMEMFDHTYQAKLDKWVEGQWDWPEFLRQTHWYANWGFDDSLYHEILESVRMHKLRLVGLNIPFCLPPKIATGGLASLSDREKALLPEKIDTGNPDHRDYVHTIYARHGNMLKGRDVFEYFYEAQCAWEDGMASAVAGHCADGQMVALAGNGHIIRKFGIPDRAHRRKAVPFLTVYLAQPGEEIATGDADFIWIAPSMSVHNRM